MSSQPLVAFAQAGELAGNIEVAESDIHLAYELGAVFEIVKLCESTHFLRTFESRHTLIAAADVKLLGK
jgi:hypothetical protein